MRNLKHIILLSVTFFTFSILNNVSAQENQKEIYYWSKIQSIYDGDTFTVMIDLGFETFKYETIRIARIDAPEVRGKEKKQGIIARDSLANKLNSGYCYVIYMGRDKYGRALCEVYTSDAQTNISDWMIENNYAEIYK